MALSPALATLFDDARAEAKRAGHSVVTALHLAAALARRAPHEFEAAFGPGSTAALQHRLLQAAPEGNDAETLALLEGAGSDDPVAVIAALKRELGAIGPAGAAPSVADAAPGAADSTVGPAEGAPAQAGVGAPSARAAAAPQHGPSATPAPGHDGRLLERVQPDGAIRGFEGLLDELVSLLAMRTPAVALVHGPAGCGKSSVAAALATRLGDAAYHGPLAGCAVMRVLTAAALSEDPVAALDRALDAQQASEVVIVDDLESLLSLGSPGIILPMLARLRGAVGDPARRLVLMIDDAYTSRLGAVDEELLAALTPVEVPSLALELLWEIAREQGRGLAAHHGVALDDPLVRLAASPRASGDRRTHPGLLRDRLDRACARAALRAEKRVQEQDLGLGAPEVAPLGADALRQALGERVRGQDAALRVVAARLALTRAQLDLRPGRPDGVFLFVGPTGVGKTELARALCERLFGSEERLVRLDMSEYAEPWALARLIGPQPGYVGFTEPDAWLTTRIRKQPETVLLLDEIEKAHPTVWNAFLQVFDAGRLSDARGNVASFERTVIAMTSNLGGTTFRSAPIGFAVAQDDDEAARRDEQRVLAAVKQALAPELINRIDEIVVFAPLSLGAIEEIARLELQRMCARLAERGYMITIADAVIELIAATGYDPAYGARHLQRNVERLLLEPLASITARELVAEVADGRVVWREQSG